MPDLDLAIARKQIYSDLPDPKPPKFQWGLLVLSIVIFAGIAGVVLFSDANEVPPGIEIDKDGNISLSPKRQAKLDKELEEIDDAVQYALVATDNRLYPCYSCPNGRKFIYLKFGETWKYGVTRKNLEGRYPNGSFGAPELEFKTLFRGTYSECLKREKIMISMYRTKNEFR